MAAANPISPTIPLDAPGAHFGHLRLPVSTDTSAWGNVMIPIAVLNGGPGPTALLIGGNHGDEYEGPIALNRLARGLDATLLAGRVILLPALNHPAFLAARRTSPLDGANMNRIFPGRPDGGPSEKIADFVTSELLPRADLVLDIHSGGRTLQFLPFAASHVLDDPAQDAACAAAASAFRAPFTVRMREIDAAGMLDTVAEAMGKVFVTTELGGAGMATAETTAIAERGARNLLIHAGILDEPPAPGQSRRLEFPETGAFLFAEEAGLIDYLCDFGAQLAPGTPIARIWPTSHVGRPPRELCAPRAGILAGRHVPGLVAMGDCVAVIAVPG